MSREHVDHSDIVNFAHEKVNLSREKANEYRAQVRRLREKLEAYLKEHPEFTLKKMMLSGSLAKGTALRSLNDIDVACYVGGNDVPSNTDQLVKYLAERLCTAFPNFSSDQVRTNNYSVTVSFKGTGLDVDIVPILYDGNDEWYGKLVSQNNGSLLLTNIQYHLDFIQKRKKTQENDFAQVVRLIKFWISKLKQERSGFRFKSFMAEMILSKLCDDGLDFSDYPEALQHCFTYIAKTDLSEQIVFADYYDASKVGKFSEPIQIIDPVNADNNVASLYTSAQAKEIVEVALEAGDALDSALVATNKEKTIYYWQKIFGTTFHA